MLPFLRLLLSFLAPRTVFNRIAFGGSYSFFFKEYVLDLTKREFFMLFALVFFTVLLGVYPSIILDSLHYSVSCLIYQTSGDFAFSFLPLLFLPKTAFNKAVKKRVLFQGYFNKTANKAVLFPVSSFHFHDKRTIP